MDVKCHKEKLASFCRRCGNFFDTNPATSRHKPKLAVTFSKELQAVDGLDVSNDSEEMHPPSLCRCCILKLERFKKSRNRHDRQLKFPGDKEFSLPLKRGQEIKITMDEDMATDSLERTPEGEPRNQQNTYRGNYSAVEEKKSQNERDYNEISILCMQPEFRVYMQPELRVMIMRKEVERLMLARRTVDMVRDINMATDSWKRTPEGEPRNQQNTYRGNYSAVEAFREEIEALQRGLRKFMEMMRERIRWDREYADLQGKLKVRLDEVAGKGSYGEVWKGELCGIKVAVKIPHKSSSECQNLFELEVRIMRQLQHPNVVKFIAEGVDDDGLLCAVQEYADRGSLGELFRKRPLTRLEVFSFGLDAASGLLYLHTRSVPILHRDLHPFNLLLFLIDKPPGKVLKLCDFGTANFLRSTMTPDQGAPYLHAPETRTQHYTTKADVYSFGLLLLIMSIGDWPNLEILECEVQRVFDTSLQELIKECTAQNPESRPDMGKVVAMLMRMKSGAVSTHF